MIISPEQEKRDFEDSSGKTFKGDGYTVQHFAPIAIRYEESGKHIAVSAEFQSEYLKWTTFLPWILRIFIERTWLAIQIEEPMVWDNSSEQPITPEDAIIERIIKTLKWTKYTIRRVPTRLKEKP
ncbi:MAG: hypothetical protein ABSD72_16175 [Terracidiphilus sp.]|jgi:hypothetical protein